jgi:hypothetical protein
VSGWTHKDDARLQYGKADDLRTGWSNTVSLVSLTLTGWSRDLRGIESELSCQQALLVLLLSSEVFF